jgi:hypothetical protein
LPEILSVDWRRLEDNPGQGGAYGGFQDSDGGFLDEEVVLTAFGYAGGGHFLNTAWLKNTSDPSGNWTALPAAPVSGRQEVGAAIIDGSAYFVGGFSYTAPVIWGTLFFVVVVVFLPANAHAHSLAFDRPDYLFLTLSHTTAPPPHHVYHPSVHIPGCSQAFFEQH